MAGVAGVDSAALFEVELNYRALGSQTDPDLAILEKSILTSSLLLGRGSSTEIGNQTFSSCSKEDFFFFY